MLLAGSIFLLTLVLVIWQPRGLSIGWSASIGAVLALISGVVHFGAIPVVWNIVWNATATFIAVIIISLLLDESGFFEWAALHVSRWGNGRGRLLFTYIVLLGAAVAGTVCQRWSGIDSDGPIVIAHAACIKFQAKGNTLAFFHGRRGLIADTASLPLIVSNLVNIGFADFFGLGFTEYASSNGAGGYRIHYRHAGDAASVLPQRYSANLRPGSPESTGYSDYRSGNLHNRLDSLLPSSGWLFRTCAVGYPEQCECCCKGCHSVSGGEARAIPFTLAKLLNGGAMAYRHILSGNVSGGTMVLRNAGLTEYLSGVLNVLADKGLWAATFGTGFLTAFLSSIMNNMPTVLVGALSIDGSTATGVIKEAMIFANVIGCDLGPKITPIGSLATLLWLHVLSQKNMTITWGYYFRTGIVMTLPVLFVTLAALALRLSFTL
uniref:ArsB n=1 Tax=Stutzerimonas stutzeri TaxID=316 RepID=Q68GK2_STUST|nr:ArsB [Stutzerimonas stutzeri]